MTYNNEKLIELYEKIQRKDHLEAVLKELRENIKLLEPAVRKLMSAMYAEQGDVEKLEGNGIKAFFTSLSGKKSEKLEKEKEEAYEAKKRYDSANFQLETMKNDLQKYLDEYNEVRYIEPEYEKAVKEKAEIIKQTNSPVAKKIAEFDEQIDVFIKKNNELRQARTAASSAAAKANGIISALNEALKMSKKDVMGVDRSNVSNTGYRYIENAKYAKLKEADYMAFELRKAMQEMDRELSDVKEADISVSIGTMAKLGDTLFDDIFSNVSVMNKINANIDKFAAIRDSINGVVGALNEEMNERERQMDALKREQDKIIINAVIIEEE